MRTEQEMIDIVLKIAKEDERIRAVYWFGSRVNPEAIRDIHQDYDISFVVTETESYQADRKWINSFGDTTICIESERNALLFFSRKDMSVLSRRCVFNLLFYDNICMDLVIEVRDEAIKNFVKYQPAKILMDKENILSGLETSTVNNYDSMIPDEDTYKACCSNFWWFLLYPAKSIARDNIPFCMVSFNTFTRTLLNRMIEWYICIEKNYSVSIGKREKNYKKYMSKNFYDLYSKTYTEKNYWNVVFITCDLFSRLALVVGKYYNFSYNKQEEDSMIKYLKKIKNNCLK